MYNKVYSVLFCSILFFRGYKIIYNWDSLTKYNVTRTISSLFTNLTTLSINRNKDNGKINRSFQPCVVVPVSLNETAESCDLNSSSDISPGTYTLKYKTAHFNSRLFCVNFTMPTFLTNWNCSSGPLGQTH